MGSGSFFVSVLVVVSPVLRPLGEFVESCFAHGNGLFHAVGLGVGSYGDFIAVLVFHDEDAFVVVVYKHVFFAVEDERRWFYPLVVAGLSFLSSGFVFLELHPLVGLHSGGLF